MTKSLRISPLLAAGCVFYSVSADDWPQWQGPQRNAISKETGLLKEWPQEGPPLVWKITGLGGGDSTPSIASGRIFGMGNRGGDEIVWARSENDGKELWVSRLGPAFEQRGFPQGKEGPGCTPTVDGERLYVLGLGGEISCLQTSDGKILWQKSLTRDFGGRVPTWSFRESPLVDGHKVICTPGAQDAMLVALDKLTGNTLWRTVMPANPEGEAAEASDPGGPGGRRGGRGGFGGRGGGSGAGYASVIAFDFEGERQYVQLTAKGLIGVAASDGEFLWRYDRPANRMGINCTTPLYHQGRVFAASAYGAGGGMVQLTQDSNGAVLAEEVWFSRNIENHHGGVVVVNDCLYGANGGNGGGYIVCLDFKTGDVLWNEKDLDKRRLKKGSVAVADGRIYYRAEEGAMVLIEPSRKEYLERGRFEQPERTNLPAWAHPVIANGKLYLRDQDTLFCYNVKSQ